MERMPFAYVATAVVFFLAFIGMYVWVYRRFQRRSSQLTPFDHFLGYCIFGPVHGSLARRGYKLTPRESFGLALILVVVLTIVFGAVIQAYAAT
jgi:hypothetical protein